MKTYRIDFPIGMPQSERAKVAKWLVENNYEYMPHAIASRDVFSSSSHTNQIDHLIVVLEHESDIAKFLSDKKKEIFKECDIVDASFGFVPIR